MKIRVRGPSSPPIRVDDMTPLTTPSRATASVRVRASGWYLGPVEVEEPDTPSDSPLRLADVLASPLYRELSTARLQPGDPAALFELPALDGRVVRLADHVGAAPVALVFGSYT